MALIDFIRQIAANEKFKIKSFDFVKFVDVSEEHPKVKIPENIEIFAEVKLHCDGEPPESYKVLNLSIGDWVENQVVSLTQVIHRELKKHLEQHYPDVDATDLDTEDDTAIWMDQLDYMPVIEDDGSIVIEIELVLEGGTDE
jgi:hypothetical protein